MTSAGLRRRSSHKLREQLFARALLLNSAVVNNHYFVGDLKNAFLVGNYKYGTFLYRLAHAAEDADKVIKTPQVYAGFGFIEDRKLCPPGEHGCDLDAFNFAAGKTGVYLPFDIIARAEPHGRKIFAGVGNGDLPARGDADKVENVNAFELHRLLERKRDTRFCAVCNAFGGNVPAVEDYLPFVGLFYTGDKPCERGFAAAVRAGNHHKLAVRYNQIDVSYYFFALPRIVHAERQIFKFQHGGTPRFFAFFLFYHKKTLLYTVF